MGTGRGRAGFTLVELLVAMAVGTLMIVFLLQVFNSSIKAWREGEDQADTYREARAAMGMMVRDLSQTIQPMTKSVYPSSGPTPTPGSTPVAVAPVLVLDRYPNPDPPRQSGDEINEEVYCLTTISNNGVSNLCAVGYFCAWKPDLATDTAQQNRAPHAYSLMRQYLGSGATEAATDRTLLGVYGRFKAFTNTPLAFTDVFARAKPPQAIASDPPVATATELAAYIWDLQIRTPTTLQDPSTNKYTVTPPYPVVLPPYVEIRFKALSGSAARQLEGNGNVSRTTWNDTNASNSIYQHIILPGTRQFSVRVPIYSGSATSTPPP